MNADGVLSLAPSGTRTGGGYPSMMGLLPPKLDINHIISSQYFTVPGCNLTVGILLHDGEAIYLIHPARSPKTSYTLVFPQEKVKLGTDGALRNTLQRGLQEELGVGPRELRLNPEELFRFENHLPLDRTGGVPQTKCIVYFGVHIHKKTVFRPNPKEVREVVRTTGDEYFDLGLASRRPHKCAAQTETIVSALMAGVLNKNSWSAFRYLARSKEAVMQ
jgi:hypothetical protein